MTIFDINLEVFNPNGGEHKFLSSEFTIIILYMHGFQIGRRLALIEKRPPFPSTL